MSGEFNTGRRHFLKATAAAGGGLLIGLYLPPAARLAAAIPAGAESFARNAFLRIAPDDSVTFVLHKSEMGQGIRTTLPMIVDDDGRVKIWDQLSTARGCEIAGTTFDTVLRRQYLGQNEPTIACTGTAGSLAAAFDRF